MLSRKLVAALRNDANEAVCQLAQLQKRIEQTYLHWLSVKEQSNLLLHGSPRVKDQTEYFVLDWQIVLGIESNSAHTDFLQDPDFAKLRIQYWKQMRHCLKLMNILDKLEAKDESMKSILLSNKAIQYIINLENKYKEY